MSAEELPVIGNLGEHAVAYGRDGLAVFPVDPATKQPMAAHARGGPSQYSATTDPEAIERWWRQWPDALVGHRPDKDVVIIDIDPRHGGDTTWKALREECGWPSPTTRSHFSGRGDGGGHIWYQRPAERITITKLDAWAESHGTGHRLDNVERHVCGLDLLHHNHRYTILPPSPHPETNKPYRWRSMADVEPMPAELADLITDTAPPPAPWTPKPQAGGESIADWFSEAMSWTMLLPRHGWTLRRGTGDDDGSEWRHPRATSPVSATIRHHCLFIFSPNTPFNVTAPSDPHGYTLFAAYALLEHGGDQSAAGRAARATRDGNAPKAADRVPDFMPPPPQVNAETGEVIEEPDPGPRLLDVRWVDEALADMPPEPDVLVSNLLRRGELTVLGAPRAIGKTWASLNLAHLAAQGSGRLFGAECFEVTKPWRVLYLQGELGRWGSVSRWQAISAGKPEHIAEIFDRVRVKVVSRRITQTIEGITTSDDAIDVSVDRRLEPTIEELGIDLVILDPWATYYSGSENDNDQVEAAATTLTDIARRTDTAWWIVHHISTKSTQGNLSEPEDLWRGATRLADNVSTRLTVLPHFTPAKVRELGLDRIEARRYIDIHHLERNGPSVPTQHAERVGWWWNAWHPVNPSGGRPVELSDRDVSSALKRLGPTSKTALAKELEVSRATLDDRLNKLEQLGVVRIERSSPGTAHLVVLTGEGLPG